MADQTTREVEKGPSFEIHQGSQQGQTGVQRLDWARNGVVRSTYVGYIGVWCVDNLIRHWEASLRLKQSVTMFHDCWDMTGYDGEFRLKLIDWGKKNPNALAAVHVLHRSKLVNMGLSVISLALPSLNLKGYGNRTEFDVLVKKLGLPLNVAMPGRAA